MKSVNNNLKMIKLKLQFVFLPFVLFSLLFIFGYLFLYWLLTIKIHLLTIDSAVEFWLAFILSIVFVVFISPLLNILVAFRPYVNRLFMYLLIFTPTLSILAGQSYMRTGFTDIGQIQSSCVCYFVGIVGILLMIYCADVDKKYWYIVDKKINYWYAIKLLKREFQPTFNIKKIGRKK